MEANLDLKKESREIEVVKAKKELAKVKREVMEKAVEVYKGLIDFAMEKA